MTIKEIKKEVEEVLDYEYFGLKQGLYTYAAKETIFMWLERAYESGKLDKKV